MGDLRERHEAHVTTPGAPELQATLAAMRAAGNAAVVLETTSHALELERVAGIAYDAAIFTNLTHEHLELHGTFERYRDAKLRLFAALAAGPANPAKIVAGRPWPKVAIDQPGRPRRPGVRGCGARRRRHRDRLRDRRHGRRARDRASTRTRATSASGTTRRPGAGSLTLRLAGRFNVHNALAVVALGEALGLDPAPSGPAWRASPACRGGWSGSTRASRSASSWTTPTRPRRCRSCWTCWRPSPRRRGAR